MHVAEARALLPKLVAKGEERPFTPNTHVIGPETYYTLDYEDEASGIVIVTASKLPGGDKRVQSIVADEDSAAITSRGVKIGDKAGAFKRAYAARERIQPIPGEFWVRFSEDEMLTVLIDDGRVHALYLGPAMEPADIEE